MAREKRGEALYICILLHWHRESFASAEATRAFRSPWTFGGKDSRMARKSEERN